MAERLATAGLNRVTVSLDSLDDETFRAMNDVDFPVADVLAGIDAALAAGLGPVKVNMVVKRGANERQHPRDGRALPRHRRDPALHRVHGRRRDQSLAAGRGRAVGRDRAAIGERWPIEPVEAGYRGEVATRYRYLDGGGEIGFISSVTQPFCHDCTRARLSAEGKLYTCLFAVRGHDLRAMVRGELSDRELDEQLRGLWRVRDDRYSELRAQGTAPDLPKVEMSHIGG